MSGDKTGIRHQRGHRLAFRKEYLMLAIVAAVLFAIAFLIEATGTSTAAVFSPTSLLLLGLTLLALHQAGVGTASGWGSRRRR
jgi:uncharacterized membrane protein SpoIIM required for sporulation